MEYKYKLVPRIYLMNQKKNKKIQMMTQFS